MAGFFSILGIGFNGLMLHKGWKAYEQNGLVAELWPIACITLLFLFILFIDFVVYLAPVREGKRRRTHAFTLTPEGISFSDTSRQVSAKWEEVTATRKGSYGKLLRFSGRYEVETRQGTFDFIATIPNSAALIECIDSLARNRTVNRWTGEDENDQQAVAPPTSKVSTFKYRSRDLRSILLFATFFPLLLMTITAARHVKGHPADTAGWVLLAGFGSVAIYGWLCFLKCAVILDSAGINKQSPFRQITIPWGAVEEYFIKGSDSVLVVRSQAKEIRISGSISRVEALQAQISAHAVNAKQSKWEIR